jgi:hypothetical protein
MPEDKTKTESSSEIDVKNVIVNRLDGIKNRDEGTARALMVSVIASLMTGPPFKRQEPPRQWRTSSRRSKFL